MRMFLLLMDQTCEEHALSSTGKANNHPGQPERNMTQSQIDNTQRQLHSTQISWLASDARSCTGHLLRVLAKVERITTLLPLLAQYRPINTNVCSRRLQVLPL